MSLFNKAGQIFDDMGGAVQFGADYVPVTEAEAQAIIAASIPAPTKFDQIAALEATITQRRMREALLGVDGGWLAAVDAQIAALRLLP